MTGLSLPDEATLRRAALLLAGASAAAILFSGAVSQILLGAALLTLIVARVAWRLPPVHWPLAAFFAGTVLALLLSPDPGAGFSQVKKFFVYVGLAAVYTTFRGADDARRLVLVWGGLAAASGLWAFVQFFMKRQQAIQQRADFYLYYVANRVTGFRSHWMEFSGELMIAGLMLAALVLFAGERRRWWIAVAIIAGGIAIAWTRSVWLGTAAGAVYLIAAWRPRLLLLMPVLLAAVFAAAPGPARDRITSIWSPQANVDSNDHRRITFRTGLEMIKAHPWFGLGPDLVGPNFDKYVPEDVPRPLPAGFYGHLHNFYLQYAADRGIPTLGALLWLIGKVLTDFSRALHQTAAVNRAILHGAIAAILGILAEGLFEHNINDTEILTMFVAVVAMGYIAACRPAESPACSS
jgi:O-antigen ligase